MSRDEYYLAEYAKSGNSQCRTCWNGIEKNTLRLAEMVNNGYGMNTEWHHFVCFWKKNRQFATKDCARTFRNFWKLKEEDMKMLREHFRYGRGPVPRVERKNTADGENCAKCAKTLPAGSLQLTYILTVYHPQCFANMENQNWIAVESFDGFGSLTNEEQETIKEIFKSAADAKAARDREKEEETNRKEEEAAAKKKEEERRREAGKKQLLTVLCEHFKCNPGELREHMERDRSATQSFVNDLRKQYEFQSGEISYPSNGGLPELHYVENDDDYWGFGYSKKKTISHYDSIEDIVIYPH